MTHFDYSTNYQKRLTVFTYINSKREIVQRIQNNYIKYNANARKKHSDRAFTINW